MPVIRDKDGNIVEIPTQKLGSAQQESNTFRVPRSATGPVGGDTVRASSPDAGPDKSGSVSQKTVIYKGSIDGAQAGIPATAGWLVVIEGPGRGLIYPVGYGVNTIGRSASNRICLDFGDAQTSSEAQCTVTFDPDDGVFYAAGGKGVNLTKHNGRPLSAANSSLNDRDLIRFGETTLMFIALCNADFRW